MSEYNFKHENFHTKHSVTERERENFTLVRTTRQQLKKQFPVFALHQQNINDETLVYVMRNTTTQNSHTHTHTHTHRAKFQLPKAIGTQHTRVVSRSGKGQTQGAV